MKVSAIQAGLYPNIQRQGIKNSHANFYSTKKCNTDFKGTSGGVLGLCIGGLLGYFTPIILGLYGYGISWYTALSTLCILSGTGAYCGDKIEDKIDNKLNNKK